MIIRYFNVLMAALAVMTMVSCHGAASGHDHDHDGDEAVNEKNHDDEDHAHEANEHDAHGEETDDIHFTEAQAKACCLTVQTLTPSPFAEVVHVSGRVLPAQGAEATVTATMAGIVAFTGKSMTEGAAVSAGTTLFVVDAKSMADGNPAAVAQSELKAARLAYERAKKLAADNIVSQRELEEARQRFEAAKATAKSLGSAAQRRGVATPIGGYIKNLLVKPGDYVTAGQPLATVTQSRRVQLRADVPERFYTMLPRIVTANFRMAYDSENRVYSIKELGGRLVSKGKASDTDDHFVPVIFEFNNTGDIVAGSFAEVYLQGAQRNGVLAVPSEAVTEAQGLFFVYVKTAADIYRRVEVKTGATDGHRIEILSGLKAGDKVVAHGATQVRLAASASVVPEGHHH